jgi:predicted RNA-binding protein YlqC (UPF0109 family)
MKELIKQIAQALVDYPDKVMVDEISGNQTSVSNSRSPRKILAR